LSAAEQSALVHLDEYVYKIVPIPARKGMLAMRRVLALAALLPADKLRAAADAFKRGAREKSPEMMLLGVEMLGGVAAGTRDEDLLYLVDALSQTCWFARAETPENLVPLAPALDVHFMQSYRRMALWFWHALLTNFPDFHRAFASLAEAQRAAAKTAG
jgi:hypothetical protein